MRLFIHGSCNTRLVQLDLIHTVYVINNKISITSLSIVFNEKIRNGPDFKNHGEFRFDYGIFLKLGGKQWKVMSKGPLV